MFYPKKNTMITLSIIIVSFNTKQLTYQCIQSIYHANLHLSFEIIVVDNNSQDGSIDAIKKQFNEIKFIENNYNKLFAVANNQGAKIAIGKYLLLLNSDTIVIKGEIEKLIRFIENAPNKIACIGPTILNLNGTTQSQGFALPGVFERISMVFKLNKILHPRLAKIFLPIGIPNIIKADHEVGWISGCCMLIKKDVYDQVGGLNEELMFYGEEPELGWRLNKNGYKTWLISNSTVIHMGGQSSKLTEADFLEDIDGKLHRYSQLQKFTVGYRKSIIMSQIVVFAAYFKKAIARNSETKIHFENAIKYEKNVVKYLAQCIKMTNL